MEWDVRWHFQGIWWGMIIGVLLQTATLIILTARTNWSAEVINFLSLSHTFIFLPVNSFPFKAVKGL
jgi:hypothetical protein